MKENDETLQISSELKSKLEYKYKISGLDSNQIIEKLIEENNTLKQNYETLTKDFNKLKRLKIDALEIGDAISDGICIVDKDGIVISINKGYTEITEIGEEEIIGKYINDMLEKGYFTRTVSVLVLEQKKKISSMSTITRNGKKVLITGNPFFDEHGEIIQVLTVMRDLTELIKIRDKLEEAERKSKKYLNELKSYKDGYSLKGFIGESTPIKKVKELVKQVAKTDATVLITGETGVGKEVVAREVHKNSNRNNKPYIKINCAAIPETLLESELFGYEKGAFTGADKKEKLGLFEKADKGTILLDEIGEMPLKLQAKLLRVLQEKEITRVGGTDSISINVRVIASTNQNISEQIKQGTFREDLFYRLNVVPITIPPLRERKQDITLLAYHFLKKYNKKYNKNKRIEIIAINALEQYGWPGNVRELENIIERLIIVETEDSITDSSIINILGQNKFINDFVNSENIYLKDAVKMLEKSIIEKALKKHRSTYKVAKILGVTQPTIVRKAKSLGIKDW